MKQHALALTVLLLLPVLAHARAPEDDDVSEDLDKVETRLSNSARVLNEILDAPDRELPQDLLDRAECVVVIPSMKKAGLGIGGRYGRGAVSCRTAEGMGPWGPPSMLKLEGGSIGFQIGVTSVDVLMLVMNKDGMRQLLKSKFTLGGDASVAAGPVGRAGTAETDAYMTAKILTYSRSKGLFAGLELKGASVRQDCDGNRALYGRSVEAKRLLLRSTVPVPAAATEFVTALDRHSPVRTKKAP